MADFRNWVVAFCRNVVGRTPKRGHRGPKWALLNASQIFSPSGPGNGSQITGPCSTSNETGSSPSTLFPENAPALLLNRVISGHVKGAGLPIGGWNDRFPEPGSRFLPKCCRPDSRKGSSEAKMGFVECISDLLLLFPRYLRRNIPGRYR